MTKTIAMTTTAYNAYGAYEQGVTMQECSAKFHALGGETWKVLPAWRMGSNWPTDKVVVTVSGSTEAVAYVEAICSANEQA